MAEKNKEKTEKIPIILDGKFFEIVGSKNDESDKGTIKARCMFCKNFCKNLYGGSVYATTNFLKHLKNIHPIQAHNFEKYKQEQTVKRNKTSDGKS